MRGKSGRRVSSGNRVGMIIIAIAVAMLIVVMLARSVQLQHKINYYRTVNAATREAMTEEADRTEELEILPDYIESDEFIEKAAREKFGLVYDDEVLFKAAE